MRKGWIAWYGMRRLGAVASEGKVGTADRSEVTRCHLSPLCVNITPGDLTFARPALDIPSNSEQTGT